MQIHHFLHLTGGVDAFRPGTADAQSSCGDLPAACCQNQLRKTDFFSSKFLLGALESLSAVIVYPVFSVGTILTVTLAGVLLFRERLEKRQWIGMLLILAALVLLNI